jgi:C-3',4' desaturase CrtD
VTGLDEGMDTDWRLHKRVIIIGAGIGGLTVAALLTRAGMDVTVLEAHVDPGGSAATFFHQVHLPDRVITRWGDAAMWREEVRRALPRSERFWDVQQWAADRLWAFAAGGPPWPPQGIADALELAQHMRPAVLGLAPGLIGSVGGWARRLGASGRAFNTFVDAQLLISAQATAEHVTPLYGAAALDLARQGVYHVAGGVGGLADALVAVIRRDGGKVLFKRRATRIEHRRGRVVAVHAQGGPVHAAKPEEHGADVVVANVTPWDLRRLLGDTQAPPEPRAGAAPMWGAFTLYLGVDAAAVPAGLADHHQIIADYDRPLGEGNSMFVSLSPTWDASRAPRGRRALTLSTHTRVEPWWALQTQAAGAAYEDRRAKYVQRLLDAGNRVLPGLRRHVHLALPGSPVTFAYYTRRHRGMVGGFPQTSLFSARGPRTDIPGVYLVGDSIFPGQSTAGVTLGALRVARAILGRDPSMAWARASVTAMEHGPKMVKTRSEVHF